MSTSQAVITAAWVGRTIHSVNFIIIMRFILTQSRHYNQNKWNCAAILFISTMIASALTSISRLGMFIPIICNVTINSYIVAAPLKYVLLTFYQIRRLQVSFSKESLNELQYKQYGYNKYTFIILYTTGFLWIILIPLCQLALSHTVQIPKFGCIISEVDDKQQIFMSIAGMLYYIWDWSVLLMYIVRIIQIKRAIKKIKRDNKSPFHKIKAILQKIIILTICGELVLLFYAMILLINSDIANQPHGIIVGSLESLMPVLTIYFMAEHNNDRYMKFINVIHGVCCFCKSRKEHDMDHDMKANTIYAHNNDDMMNVKSVNLVVLCRNIGRMHTFLCFFSIFIIKICIFFVVLIVLIYNTRNP